MYKVIVAEDERLIRHSVIDFINKYIDGFSVEESFMDGRDVLDYLSSNAANVDVVITDVKMLDVSGIEVARYIYENALPIRVIILSGYQNFTYAQAAINYNVSSYLTKPVDPVELQKALNKIKEQLDREKTEPSGESRDELSHTEVSMKENKSLNEQIVIKRALAYINQHYHRDLSLGEVASLVYLSEDYFGKLFKKNTGSNFSNYLLSVRMQKAIELLKTGRYTVTETGERVGYKNTNYFIKVFREYTGYTPKKYPRFSEEQHEE